MSTDDTSASEHGADAETTQVPPTPRAEPGLAWSSDDDYADEAPANWRGRLIWAGLGVLVVAIAAALVLLVSTLLSRHTTNTARPQPVSSLPATTTVAAAPPSASVAPPPPPAPTAASASPYTSLVGKWTGHHRGLTVSPDGYIELDIPDMPACPECSAATMPYATVHIGLTSYDGKPDGTPDGSGKFFGYVKDSSDTRVVSVAVPVEVDVMNATDYSYLGGPPGYTPAGRVLTVSINGDHVGSRSEGHVLGDQVPFCDEAARAKSVCGA
ncbi:hypothetical protein [Mycobacterium paraense]|uniref:hypothetical protein n=1 Tax=Mycobacterium paraense TaxID=767916 RepID=UPI00111C00D6|nr:hypothetical protein [Mycobacterium paraense]